MLEDFDVVVSESERPTPKSRENKQLEINICQVAE